MSAPRTIRGPSALAMLRAEDGHAVRMLSAGPGIAAREFVGDDQGTAIGPRPRLVPADKLPAPWAGPVAVPGLAPFSDAAAGRAARRPRLGDDDAPPGAALVLVTDGLVERRDAPIDAGLDALADETGRSLSLTAEQLCDALLTRFGAHASTDDVAILAVTRSAG